MGTPAMTASRINKDGKPAIRFAISNVNQSAELRDALVGAGWKLEEDLSNYYSVICSTPAEIDAARNPVSKMFGAGGVWLGGRP